MTPAVAEPPRRRALAESVALLRRTAAYTLPPELDARMLHLGERKNELTPAEREELFAWIAFTEKRSTERAEALLALEQLAEAFPELVGAGVSAFSPARRAAVAACAGHRCEFCHLPTQG